MKILLLNPNTSVGSDRTGPDACPNETPHRQCGTLRASRSKATAGLTPMLADWIAHRAASDTAAKGEP